MTPDELLDQLDHFGDAYAAARIEQTDASDAREADAKRPIVEAFKRFDVELDAMLAKYDKLWNSCAFVEGERDEARAEVERLTSHSKDLNTIGFAAAKAIGLVPPGTEEILGDPVELVEMLIKQRNEADEDRSAIVEHAILMSGGSMQVRPDYPEIERIYPLDVWVEHNSRYGGKVFRRKVIVVEEWTDVTAHQVKER